MIVTLLEVVASFSELYALSEVSQSGQLRPVGVQLRNLSLVVGGTDNAD